MKRFFILSALAIILVATSAHGQNWPFLKNAAPYTTLDTMVSTTSTTVVTGPTTTLGIPFDKFSCSVTWSGLIPTSTTQVLQGSLDGTNFYTLHTQTVTTSPFVYSVESTTNFLVPPVNFYRIRQTARSASSYTTTMGTQVQCIAAH